MQILKEQSLTGKTWLRNLQDTELNQKASSLYKIDLQLANILINRGISLAEIPSFLDPKLKNLMGDPSLLKDMDKLCDRIYKSILNKEKIVILGDYDVDGITSTSILFKYLKNLGANISTYIPDRYTEGYGISIKALEKLSKQSPKLLILLDNGSVSFNEVLRAGELGIDVIIVDHHSVDVTLPQAVAFVNPKRVDDASNNDSLCTAGLVFLCLVALNNYLEKQKFFVEVEKTPSKNNIQAPTKENILKYLDLVALGTVCDMVPLVGLNRAFVFQGIKIMHKRENASLRSLADNLGINKPIDVETLGFSFGPCINAGSRMGNSQLPLDLFLSNESYITDNLSNQLILLNQKRQEEEDKIIQSATLEISQKNLSENNSIFVGSHFWSSGIVGIIAGRVKENYGKPALIYSIDKEKGTATGSGRSIEGIDLGNIIIGAKQKDLLIKGGGHSQAVGFTFSLEKEQEFFEFVESKIKYALKNKVIERNIIIDDVLSIYALSEKLATDISKIQPFGINFKEPVFMISNVKINNVKQIGQNKNHLMVEVSDGFKYKTKAFCYKCLPALLGESIISKEGLFVDLAVSVKLNFYQGKNYVNLVINDIA
jgi:single-stranded-DNA-specific exonuclease